jgi:MprA protease rhombosortase-interaction domain-containing protein
VSAATGDFNRDGFIDLALTKGSASGTEVYLNVESTTNPAQRMLSLTPLVLGDQVPSTDVLAADLDGDGDLDLVTTNNTAQSNNVFLNSGAGEFTLFATLGAGDSNAAAAGDFNGDGRLDLAFAGPTAVAIYLNGPGPTFTPATPVGTGTMREIVVADFDLDGLPDLVVANAAGPSRFHKNLGAGQFAAGVAIDSGSAESVASADFNGDGRPDLAFARVSNAVMPPSIVVYQNNPGGAAPLFVIVAGLGAAPILDVLATDVDLDSFADLVAVGASGTHQVYRGNGAGGFSLHSTQFLLAGAMGAAFGKLSVDDRVDLAVAGSAGAGVFFNDGRGGLGPGDTDAPVIQLLGEASVEVEVGTTYQDSGATATDSIDGNLTARIVTNNPVNPRIIGTYTVTYDVTDNSGNAATRATRSVRVGAREGTGGGGGGAVDPAVAAALILLCLAAYVRRRTRSRAC